MSEDERLAAERRRLLAHVEALVGPAPIPRFDEALTHPSFANEAAVPDNQRLEFLGDSVLGLCVSERIAALRPEADEGRLTRMRAALVNADALAAWGRRVGLGACIALGRGAQLGTEREQTSVLADAVEAVIAAVYEARGLAGARALVDDVIRGRLEDADALETRDPKSALQMIVQARGMSAPTYRVVEARGAAHDQTFVVEVNYGSGRAARGEGRSKKLAERASAAAARAALQQEQLQQEQEEKQEQQDDRRE